MATATPDRLSLACAGWQSCAKMSTSSAPSPRMDEFCKSQAAFFEARSNDDAVPTVGKRLQLAVGETEAPGPRVERGAERDLVWQLRHRVQIRPQLGQRHRRVDRRAVADHVEGGMSNVRVPAAAFMLDDRPRQSTTRLEWSNRRRPFRSGLP